MNFRSFDAAISTLNDLDIDTTELARQFSQVDQLIGNPVTPIHPFAFSSINQSIDSTLEPGLIQELYFKNVRQMLQGPISISLDDCQLLIDDWCQKFIPDQGSRINDILSNVVGDKEAFFSIPKIHKWYLALEEDVPNTANLTKIIQLANIHNPDIDLPAMITQLKQTDLAIEDVPGVMQLMIKFPQYNDMLKNDNLLDRTEFKSQNWESFLDDQSEYQTFLLSLDQAYSDPIFTETLLPLSESLKLNISQQKSCLHYWHRLISGDLQAERPSDLANNRIEEILTVAKQNELPPIGLSQIIRSLNIDGLLKIEDESRFLTKLNHEVAIITGQIDITTELAKGNLQTIYNIIVGDTISRSQPPKQNLIFANSDANISRDNTCKTTEALRDFFSEEGAEKSLKELIDNIEHDLFVMQYSKRTNLAQLIKEKINRLLQANLYLQKLTVVRQSKDIQHFCKEVYARLPADLHDLFARKPEKGGNLSSMLLCPSLEDPFTIAPNVVFALKRATNSSDLQKSPLHKLLHQLDYPDRLLPDDKIKTEFAVICQEYMFDTTMTIETLLHELKNLEIFNGTSWPEINADEMIMGADLNPGESIRDGFDTVELTDYTFSYFASKITS